jgi:hypothetical protein
MRVIANNLANIGTTGFKRDRADFQTLAYQEQRVAGQRSTGQTAYAIGLNLGTGVQLQGTTRIDTQGALNTTGNHARHGAGRCRASSRWRCRRAARWAYPCGQFHPVERWHAGDRAGLCAPAADQVPQARRVDHHRA